MEPKAPTIPEELIRRLHDATKRLHAARQELEQAMAGSEDRHQDRVDVAAEQVRQAERELERIDQAVRDAWPHDHAADHPPGP
jgi:septation ring formation regulator EzrA